MRRGRGLLFRRLRERLRDSGARFLVDAYCGVGFFGIEAGDLVESFVGVEIDHQAIKAAKRNAAAHGRTNGEFIEGRAEELLPGLLERFDPGATHSQHASPTGSETALHPLWYRASARMTPDEMASYASLLVRAGRTRSRNAGGGDSAFREGTPSSARVA